MTNTTETHDEFQTIGEHELPSVTGAWGCRRSTTVKAGDTLTAIANRYHMPLGRLISLNGQIKNPNLIHPGDRVYTGFRWGNPFFRR
jgi:hypothetical protein